MGERVFSRDLYVSAVKKAGLADGAHVTKRAEQQALNTGKLEPLVDPSAFGVIRLSLPRVEDVGNGQWKMLVGTPMPIETRVDTTGSMGGNVDIAMRVLPNAFDALTEVLEGYDIHVATGIFGDMRDRFPLCRPQFEMQADKIVNQLSLMVPERQGHDTPEDPDIGIFGGAYLCRHYINNIGLKGYDFTVTDAPGRGIVGERELIRVFGDDVFSKIEKNGFKANKSGSYDLKDIWSDLLKRAHAFVVLIKPAVSTLRFWYDHVGNDRVVSLDKTENLPYLQAAIIGLTEGTLLVTGVKEFLRGFNLNCLEIDSIANSVVGIPIAAQKILLNYGKKPMKGDIFDGKPDVWENKHIWPVASEKTEVVIDENDEWA